MIYKSVLIKIIALLCRHIENFGRLHLSGSICGYELCVLTEMAHAVGTDLLRQGNRNDLFFCRDKPSRLVNYLENGFYSLFNHRKPGLVNHLVENSVHLMELVVTCLYHLKHVLEISVITKCLFHTSRILLVQIRDCKIILGILRLLVIPFIRARHSVSTKIIPCVRAWHSVSTEIIPRVRAWHSVITSIVPCIRAWYSVIPGTVPRVRARHSVRNKLFSCIIINIWSICHTFSPA